MSRNYRIAVLCILGCGLLYVGATLGLFLFVKYQQGHTEIAYSDLLLPNHWHRFQVNKGQIPNPKISGPV
jgi:hypothetical protein